MYQKYKDYLANAETELKDGEFAYYDAVDLLKAKPRELHGFTFDSPDGSAVDVNHIRVYADQYKMVYDDESKNVCIEFYQHSKLAAAVLAHGSDNEDYQQCFMVGKNSIVSETCHYLTQDDINICVKEHYHLEPRCE